MNLDKIGHGECPNKVKAFIEVPYGSNIKYELDKDSGVIEVDRVMFSAMFYPTNYGFVPNTLSDDGDPADILVFGDYSLVPGCVINARLIGVLMMEDESGVDEKLLAVPHEKVDPTFKDVKDIDDVPEHTLNRIKNFFETYKMLEPNKWVKIIGFKGKDEAAKILEQAINNYKG
jgi:inorganic pyrophosphatase